jgi:twitching motility protein PilT
MISKILTYGRSNKCSDVHISSSNPPLMRVDGDLIPISKTILTEKNVFEIIDSITTEEQRKTYEQTLELDFSFQIDDVSRFRVNVFKTITGPAIVFREIPNKIANLLDLSIPSSIADLTKEESGLILVTGPTGSGKSTTIAAMIDHINQSYNYHIITIEDPIEFVHKSKKSLVNQREVGRTTMSFAAALRSALREDPDIILVGEMRDQETIQLALTAAETGHLVFATLHTNSSAQTINRIIDVFPSDSKASVRSMFSTSIKAVISQKLLKKEGGGRVAAYEIMLANASVRNLIREDKVPQINSIIEINKKSGMIQMKDSITTLLNTGQISQEVYEEAMLAYS